MGPDARQHEVESLAHRLTPDERATFETDGYLQVPDALPAPLVARLAALADDRLEEHRRATGCNEHAVLNRHGVVADGPDLLDLVDWPRTFPKVWGILGWNLQLFHSQLIVTPPADRRAPHGGYAWHRDNNRMDRDLDVSPPLPRISLKVGFFVSDVSAAGRGNLCVVPGSHLVGDPEPDPATGQPSGARELLARPGDAVIFDRRLWHAASTNHSSTTRKLLTYGYSHRWLRTKSAIELADDVIAGCDPVRRQLLGAATGPNGRFDPRDEDVPLRAWIAARCGDEAVVP